MQRSPGTLVDHQPTSAASGYATTSAIAAAPDTAHRKRAEAEPNQASEQQQQRIELLVTLHQRLDEAEIDLVRGARQRRARWTRRALQAVQEEVAKRVSRQPTSFHPGRSPERYAWDQGEDHTTARSGKGLAQL